MKKKNSSCVSENESSRIDENDSSYIDKALFAEEVIEIFDNFLKKNHIELINSEEQKAFDEVDSDDVIYGDDYFELLDSLEPLIENGISRESLVKTRKRRRRIDKLDKVLRGIKSVEIAVTSVLIICSIKNIVDSWRDKHWKTYRVINVLT